MCPKEEAARMMIEKRTRIFDFIEAVQKFCIKFSPLLNEYGDGHEEREKYDNLPSEKKWAVEYREVNPNDAIDMKGFSYKAFYYSRSSGDTILKIDWKTIKVSISWSSCERTISEATAAVAFYRQLTDFAASLQTYMEYQAKSLK